MTPNEEQARKNAEDLLNEQLNGGINKQEKMRCVIGGKEVTILTNKYSAKPGVERTPLKTVEKVLVRIPKHFTADGQENMHFIAAQEDVSEYWHFGYKVGKGIYLNTHFRGLSEDDFGRNICATVKVYTKIMPDSRQWTNMDITKTNGEKPEFELKMLNEQKVEDDIQILGTSIHLHFEPMD